GGRAAVFGRLMIGWRKLGIFHVRLHFVGRFCETPTVSISTAASNTDALQILKYPAQRDVEAERNPEANKPRVIVKRDEKRRDTSGLEQFHRHKKSRQVRQDRDQERDQRDNAEAV